MSDPQSHPEVRRSLRVPQLSSEVLRIGLHDLMQPTHRRTVTGVPERLELAVPRAAAQTLDLLGQPPLTAGRLEHGCLQPLLRHHDVALYAGGRMEDAERGRDRVTLGPDGAARLLGDLEPQLLPSAQS